MDYGVLPPEINSGRMYTGPGSGSMLTAAAAWQELSAELNSTAAMFDSVTSALVAGAWTGPTATAMVAAAAPYVTWLRGTGAQAEQTARQAGIAAQAYATALAAVVPPPLIAANRALLHQLVASNFFGQNSPAIAEAERQYAEMWAADAAAMYRYASSSAAAASMLSAFSRPPQTTNTSGQLAQSTAVAQAGSAAASNDATSIASIIGSFSPYTGVATQAASATMTSWSGTANMLSNINNGIGLTAFTAENPSGLDEILHPPFLGPAGLGLGGLGLGGRALGGAGLGGLGLGGAGLSASAGNALKIGALTVPHGWAMPTTLASASAPLPAAAVPAAVGGVPGTAFGETMLGTLAGRGLGAATARAASHRRTVVPRPPAAG